MESTLGVSEQVAWHACLHQLLQAILDVSRLIEVVRNEVAFVELLHFEGLLKE